MTIQAYIAHRYLNDSLDVYIVKNIDGYLYALQMDAGGQTTWTECGRSGDTVRSEEPPPTVVLPQDSGRVLLEALVRHYQGTEDTRALRRDYDNERKRVDEQNKVIADIALTLAQGGPRG